ncbi:MAG TPA: adenosylmethionine--8-amino-7-oxononanoate transaminase [Chthoniobacterales bacterium]
MTTTNVTLHAWALDKKFGWHPFTPMEAWCAPEFEPLVIVRGTGPYLFDSEGNRYLDGNSSIWVNIHGHAHPRLNAAIANQLDRIAHSSFLGFTHPLAGELAARLCGLFSDDDDEKLTRVFFGDNGSTAIEVALKISAQYWMQNGQPQRTRFVGFTEAYHGDTMGAASLGGNALFHERFRVHHFPVTHVRSVGELDDLPQDKVAAVVVEPLIQGVAGMRPWPAGMLAELRVWTKAHGIHLILDEVMTGFGRTGRMFACQHEDVVPDFLCLAKGLTGGYLPMSATLMPERIFEGFLGEPSRAVYYGHSYTANPLGCAAALASLDLFEEEKTLEKLQGKIAFLREELATLAAMNPNVSGVRQCGFIAGIDVIGRSGAEVCLRARKYGLLTRPIRDTVVLMLPLCVSEAQIREAISAIGRATAEV